MVTGPVADGHCCRALAAQQEKKGTPAIKCVALDDLETVSMRTWDETAVRNVLQAFVFGGHATETQIRNRALMHPELTIQQMLNFTPTNRRLSDPGLDSAGQPRQGWRKVSISAAC